MALESKTIERLKALVAEAVDKSGGDAGVESEATDIFAGLEKLFDEQIAAAIAPLQEKITANLERIVSPHLQSQGPDRVKGLTAARALRAWVFTGGNRRDATAFAKSKWGDDEPAIGCIQRAMVAGQEKTLIEGGNSAGGFLVSGDPAGEIIELLRKVSIVRQMGPVIMPMSSDSKPIPRISGGSTSGYIGETAADTASDLQFQQLVLRVKKLRALVALSNELNDDADDAADQMVINDITESMGSAEDVAFIRSIGSENSPKGLRYWASAANVVASVASNDGSDPTLAEVREDLSAMITLLENAETRMIRPVWLMSGRTFQYMAWNLTDGNSNLVFGPEMATGKLNGWPIGKSNNIPSNLADGTRGESELYLVDMADVVIGDRKQIEFAVSDSASFTDSGSNTVSAFNNDLLVIRAIARHDLIVRHATSIAVRTGIVYTAS